MKNKIVGIVILMLVATTVVSAINVNVEEKTQTTASEADVPLWKVGDTWTYDAHIYMAASPNVIDDMVLDVRGELVLEVSEVTGETYQLTGLMKPLTGTVDIPGNLGFRLTRISSFTSNLEIQKTNLSLRHHDYTMKGICLLTLGPIPLLIPIQMQTYKKTEFGPMWEILPFPLYDGKTGDYDNSTYNEEWKTTMFWGLIPIASGTSNYSWVGGEAPYNCKADSITVPAGTYDVYNVSCYLDFGTGGQDYYFSNYAEDVGNIVSGIYNLDFGNGNTAFFIELGLKSTTYEP
jgi:hypothetical protein